MASLNSSIATAYLPGLCSNAKDGNCIRIPGHPAPPPELPGRPGRPRISNLRTAASTHFSPPDHSRQAKFAASFGSPEPLYSACPG